MSMSNRASYQSLNHIRLGTSKPKPAPVKLKRVTSPSEPETFAQKVERERKATLHLNFN